MRTNPNDIIHDDISWGIDTGVDRRIVIKNGLTKREYFAACALSGLLASAKSLIKYEDKQITHYEGAVIAADFLIEALNKETK